MSRTLDINIKATITELKKRLQQQQKGRIKERLQVLYLLKTKPAPTALAASQMLGRAYSTVKRWLKTYRQSGIEPLLELKSGGNKPLSLSVEVLKVLEKRLQQSEGFAGYHEIQEWLKETYGIDICYSTLHGIVHGRLTARPKVVRPQSVKRDDSKAIDFKKKGFTVKSDGSLVTFSKGTLLVYG